MCLSLKWKSYLSLSLWFGNGCGFSQFLSLCLACLPANTPVWRASNNFSLVPCYVLFFQSFWEWCFMLWTVTSSSQRESQTTSWFGRVILMQCCGMPSFLYLYKFTSIKSTLPRAWCRHGSPPWRRSNKPYPPSINQNLLIFWNIFKKLHQ